MKVGQVIGNWTFIATDRSNGRIRYLCRCVCGVQRVQYAGNITSGKSVSCGCTTKGESLVGKRYGRLTVASTSTSRGSNGAYLQICRCICGTTVEVERTNLRAGYTTSCGCLAKESATERNTTHGLSGHPLYAVWTMMHARCYNPRNKAYPNYGGRGIKVCRRWHTFRSFLSDVGERPEGKSLDRRDNNRDYSPDNCKWSTQVEQCNNKSTNVWLTARGETRTNAEWTRLRGLGKHTIYNRLRLGWSAEEAIFGKEAAP